MLAWHFIARHQNKIMIIEKQNAKVVTFLIFIADSN